MTNTVTTRKHDSKTPAIIAAAVLGALALTPIALKSFGNNPQAAQIGKVGAASNSTSTANITAASAEQNKAGYSVGYMLGSNAKQAAPDLTKADIMKGLTDAYEGKAALTPAQMEQVIKDYQQHREESMKKDFAASGTKNLQEGQAFLAQNAKKAGVKTTASGLQYEVLKEGTGAKPKATDVVSVKYEGKTLDGKVFDSTEKQGGTPAEFPLNQVIPGWTEGVQLMTEGSKYRFYIPANLAYGEQGAPQGGIGANSVLIFDIELLKVSAPKAAQAGAPAGGKPSAEEQAEMQAQLQAAIAQQAAGQQTQGQSAQQPAAQTAQPAK